MLKWFKESSDLVKKDLSCCYVKVLKYNDLKSTIHSTTKKNLSARISIKKKWMNAIKKKTFSQSLTFSIQRERVYFKGLDANIFYHP